MQKQRKHISFGAFDVEVNHFAAYFYLHMEPLSPPPPPEDVPAEEWKAYDDVFMAFQNTSQNIDVDARLKHVRTFLEGLAFLVQDLGVLCGTDHWTEENIQGLFYASAKSTFGDEKSSIREFFKLLYLVVFQTESGPRWGQFLMIVGYDRFVEIIKERSEVLPALPRH